MEFSPEDAARSDPEFLYEVLEQAIRAGATTLNIPDTVGYATPEEFGALIRGIVEHVPGATGRDHLRPLPQRPGPGHGQHPGRHPRRRAPGRVTVNGIGERAGNTSLEEVVMALYTRPQFFGLRTGVDTTQIVRTSRMVSTYTGIPVQPNKAIVGANAFAHEAGIHQDGMLKNPLTYEIMRPETVGLSESNLVLGKHSGRHAFNTRLEAMGYELTREQLDQVFERFKQVCDKKKVVDDRDLEALIADELYQPTESYRLEYVQVTCGTGSTPTATVRLRARDGRGVHRRRHRRRAGGRRVQGHQPRRGRAQRAHRVRHQGRHRGHRLHRRGDHPHPVRRAAARDRRPASSAATAPAPTSSWPAAGPT